MDIAPLTLDECRRMREETSRAYYARQAEAQRRIDAVGPCPQPPERPKAGWAKFSYSPSRYSYDGSDFLFGLPAGFAGKDPAWYTRADRWADCHIQRMDWERANRRAREAHNRALDAYSREYAWYRERLAEWDKAVLAAARGEAEAA